MEIAKQIFPQRILGAIQSVYHGIGDIRKKIRSRLGWFNPNDEYDEEYYAKRRKDPWRSDSRNVAAALDSVFNPSSVIDFGCAIGAYLEPFHSEGGEIHGVDAVEHAFDHAVVPREHLEHHDLTEPYESETSYDLVVSIEVAEHLPEHAADTFVDTLVDAGDTIVMTAASPGQGGTNHLNEQPPSYWIEKFESRGFKHDQGAVDQLRQQINVEKMTWIEENLFVFRSAHC